LSSQHESVLSLQIPEHNCLVYFKTLSYLSHSVSIVMLPFSVVLLQQIHCYAIWLLRYHGNATNSLLHNRNHYVTMEMQYNSLLHNRNCYVTMEMPSRPNISQYFEDAAGYIGWMFSARKFSCYALPHDLLQSLVLGFFHVFGMEIQCYRNVWCVLTVLEPAATAVDMLFKKIMVGYIHTGWRKKRKRGNNEGRTPAEVWSKKEKLVFSSKSV
jgi:hypothetical protein